MILHHLSILERMDLIRDSRSLDNPYPPISSVNTLEASPRRARAIYHKPELELVSVYLLPSTKVYLELKLQNGHLFFLLPSSHPFN